MDPESCRGADSVASGFKNGKPDGEEKARWQPLKYPGPRGVSVSLSTSVGLSPTWPPSTRPQASWCSEKRSTHGALVEGIQNTMNGAGGKSADAYLFLHGSTIAIKHSWSALAPKPRCLSLEGFRDNAHEIGRVNRPEEGEFVFFSKHAPLVKRSSRFRVSERAPRGRDRAQVDEDAVRALARSLKVRGIEAVAILLLH